MTAFGPAAAVERPILPRHVGVECRRCLRRRPTAAATVELRVGDGSDQLCWRPGDEMCAFWAGENVPREFARLRARVLKLETAMADLREKAARLSRFSRRSRLAESEFSTDPLSAAVEDALAEPSVRDLVRIDDVLAIFGGE